MHAGWIVLGIGAAFAMLVLAVSWFRRGRAVDLGSVSHHWIAEQRTAPDRQR